MQIFCKTDLVNLIGKTVKFNNMIEENEGYADPNMKAVIVNVEFNIYNNDLNDRNIVHKVMFNFAQYEQHNAIYEQYNYYDKNGIPCLNARQAGFYNPVDYLYFDNNLPFEIVD